jgi:hypothetical protein
VTGLTCYRDYLVLVRQSASDRSADDGCQKDDSNDDENDKAPFGAVERCFGGGLGGYGGGGGTFGIGGPSAVGNGCVFRRM